MTAKADHWTFLKQYTHARIALGRAGHSVSTKELLDFRMAHSRARDSVWREVDFQQLQEDLKDPNNEVMTVQSKCNNKQNFLLNPNQGRKLATDSKKILQEFAKKSKSIDCLLVIADGLSADAVQSNAAVFAREFLNSMNEAGLKLGPIVLARYARVALGDEIGAAFKSRAVLMLIGERPGLASSDSLSVYFTYQPTEECTDANRNCISNIHASGLSPTGAAKMSVFLVQNSIQRKLSGVDLKIEYPDFTRLIP